MYLRVICASQTMARFNTNTELFFKFKQVVQILHRDYFSIFDTILFFTLSYSGPKMAKQLSVDLALCLGALSPSCLSPASLSVKADYWLWNS